MLLIISGKRGMAFLLEASFTLESFFSLLFQPINISLTHFSPIQLLKRLSFSRLRADRNVHQEMPWGQLSVTHQSAALKIWMVDYMSMVKQIKKKIYVLIISNIFSVWKWVQLCTPSSDGHRVLTFSGTFKTNTDAWKWL